MNEGVVVIHGKVNLLHRTIVLFFRSLGIPLNGTFVPVRHKGAGSFHFTSPLSFHRDVPSHCLFSTHFSIGFLKCRYLFL